MTRVIDAGRNRQLILFAGFDIIKIHIIRVNVHNAEKSGVGMPVSVFGAAAGLFFHRPARRADDREGNRIRAAAARTGRRDGHAARVIVSRKGHARSRARTRAQRAAAADRPGCRITRHRQPYFLADADLRARAVRRRSGDGLAAYRAGGMTWLAAASGRLGTVRGTRWCRGSWRFGTTHFTTFYLLDNLTSFYLPDTLTLRSDKFSFFVQAARRVRPAP